MKHQTADSILAEYEQLRRKAVELHCDASEAAFLDPEGNNDRVVGIEEEFELESHYSDWFTRASLLVQQVIPHRSLEFESLYYAPGSRIFIDDQTMTIQDWILGRKPESMTWDDFNRRMFILFNLQYQIFDSIGEVLRSAVANIKGLLRADLFADELEESRELLAKGFVRAAGAVAGVVLEHKLSAACTDNGVILDKRKPALGDLVVALRDAEALSEDDAALLFRLTSLRNKFSHARAQEPDESDAEELVRGVQKVFQSVFVAAPPVAT